MQVPALKVDGSGVVVRDAATNRPVAAFDDRKDASLDGRLEAVRYAGCGRLAAAVHHLLAALATSDARKTWEAARETHRAACDGGWNLNDGPTLDALKAVRARAESAGETDKPTTATRKPTTNPRHDKV